MRVVPDTNVLARAVRPGSLAAKVLAQIITGPHLLILSPVLLAEVARALRYPRLRAMHGLDDQGIDGFVAHLQAAALLGLRALRHNELRLAVIGHTGLVSLRTRPWWWPVG